MGVADKVPSNARIGVVGLALPILVLFVIILLGCVASGLSSLYLFLLEVDDTALRVGYFAICAVSGGGGGNSTDSDSSDSDDADVTCTMTVGADADELGEDLFGGRSDGDDVGPVLSLALDLQSQVLFPLIPFSTFLLLFGSVIFVMTKLAQKKLSDPSAASGALKKSKMFKPAALAFIWLAALLTFGAAVGSSVGIGALNFIIPVLATNISVTDGKILQVLQFLAFLLCLIFGVAATLFVGDPLEKQQEQLGDGNDFNVEEKELGYDTSQQQPPEVMELPDEKPEDMSDEEWEQLQQQQQEQLAQQQAWYEAQEAAGDQQAQDGQEGYPPEDGQAYDQDGQAYDQDGQAYDQDGQPYDQDGQPYDQDGQYPDDQAYGDPQGQPPYPQ